MVGYGRRPVNSGQLWHRKKLKPAIHLDNRYRLMRHEPMLDANGNETNEIGEDDTISIDDLLEEEQARD
ncbi:hypothetical protein M0804_008753 [Polistes exclamans]|nr:hypothetical protein M0804_008753 [Polistes exclamans]